MADDSAGEFAILERRARRGALLAQLLIAFALIIGLALIWRLGEAAARRELLRWQTHMGLVAEARASAIGGWLAARRQMVQSLADKTAVRLYLSERNAIAPEVAAAQERYLATLLQAAAQEWGLGVDAVAVPANVPLTLPAGLALVDREGAVIARVGNPPPPALAQGAGDGVRLEGPDFASAAPLFLRFTAPIFAVQADGGAPVGFVYATIPFAGPVQSLLAQPGDRTARAATRLLAAEAGGVRVLAARPDMSEVGQLLSRNAELDSAWAAARGDGFARLMDRDGTPVLAAARSIEGSAWTLLYSVSEAEALGPARAGRNKFLISLGLVALLAIAGVVLYWRHGAALRANRLARVERAAARDLAEAAALLRQMADEQRTAILVLDPEGAIRFANATAARLARAATPDALVGKALAAAWGPAIAHPFLKLMQSARHVGGTATASFALDFGDGSRIGRADATPLQQDHGDPQQPGAMMLVWDDLSDLIAAREKREQSLQQLVTLLVGLIDARDPYSAAHARRVMALAREIAVDLDFAETDRRALMLAALLMNLGKVLVPSTLLTKPQMLSDAELATVRAAMAKGTALVSKVDFDVPVREVMEAALGDAPAAGRPAELLRVVNAFVGMVSPRAHRQGFDVDRAVAELRAAAERFTPAMVSALAHFLDNRGGRYMIAAWDEDYNPQG
ncbi:MAG: HD domain-containing phosphohydrolase [Pseudomonadota bacterium]